MVSAVETFVAAVDPIVREWRPSRETVLAIEPYLRRLVSGHGWLEEPFRRVIPTKAYAQYLLHRPSDWAYSIVSFVWNPGQGSPIHDHCTWGVIGLYEGDEEEGRFRLRDGKLERVEVAEAHPGDVSHVYPPSRDIHQITNRTSRPTISIHIYGGDIGTQQRHVYDPQTGESRPFISGYDAIAGPDRA
jgi:predicted metal-dependent enzyme (double-stranded beta helix superfamily)